MADCEDMADIRQILASGSRCCLEDFQTLLPIIHWNVGPIVNLISLVNKSELGSAKKNYIFPAGAPAGAQRFQPGPVPRIAPASCRLYGLNLQAHPRPYCAFTLHYYIIGQFLLPYIIGNLIYYIIGTFVLHYW